MTPEALERLRGALKYADIGGETTDVRTADLLALLDAYEVALAQVDAALALCAEPDDEMRPLLRRDVLDAMAKAGRR